MGADAELVGERPTDGLIRLERVCLTPGSIEGEHQ
jgi:hypothetical protein